MGACLSCLGLSSEKAHDELLAEDQPEHSHLLYSDDPYNQSGNSYGTYGQGPQGLLPQHTMSPEELKREREALENITRWTGDHIVDVFPHKLKKQTDLANGDSGNGDGPSAYETFLSQIPGDKSTKSMRVFPVSRPGSQASGSSTRSKLSSSRLNGSVRGKGSRVFVKLDVDLT